jgi:SAM-dependent methyltransferase
MLGAVASLDDLIRPERYPRSLNYDPAWVVALDMGPHPLWLLENLDVDLPSNARVLDLGSGKGATSVFLAKEYGAHVVAADWWTPAEEAQAVFDAVGVGEQVRAVRAEAHDLPFELESFDAIISVDAFEYFGTDDHYLGYLTKFLRSGGLLAVATPGMTREIRELGSIPYYIEACVGWEALAWHTPEWWKQHWELTGLVRDVTAELQVDGWEDWWLWHDITCSLRDEDPHAGAVGRMLAADGGQMLSFTLLKARKI